MNHGCDFKFRISNLALAAATLVLNPAVSVAAAPWNLPLTISDENTTIRFEVDSTWHLVEGVTAKVQGDIRQADPGDPGSIQGDITVPVATFDTDNSSRDERLREVMKADQFSEVAYKITSAEIGCSVSAIQEGTPCDLVLNGKLKIMDTESDWKVPARITLKDGIYRLNATSVLNWSDFGVEDPSILIARLQKQVKVIISVKWNAGGK